MLQLARNQLWLHWSSRLADFPKQRRPNGRTPNSQMRLIHQPYLTQRSSRSFNCAIGTTIGQAHVDACMHIFFRFDIRIRPPTHVLPTNDSISRQKSSRSCMMFFYNCGQIYQPQSTRDECTAIRDPIASGVTCGSERVGYLHLGEHKSVVLFT